MGVPDFLTKGREGSEGVTRERPCIVVWNQHALQKRPLIRTRLRTCWKSMPLNPRPEGLCVDCVRLGVEIKYGAAMGTVYFPFSHNSNSGIRLLFHHLCHG